MRRLCGGCVASCLADCWCGDTKKGRRTSGDAHHPSLCLKTGCVFWPLVFYSEAVDCGSLWSSLAVGAVWSGCVSLAVSVALWWCCVVVSSLWCLVVWSSLVSSLSLSLVWCLLIISNTSLNYTHTKRHHTLCAVSSTWQYSHRSYPISIS